ncbi:hypothetical protein GGF44_003642, partial [Coemansia sp. RSA 1694]
MAVCFAARECQPSDGFENQSSGMLAGLACAKMWIWGRSKKGQLAVLISLATDETAHDDDTYDKQN